MPELFTSYFSTMGEKGEVGFAAIVGSAVFNVLFVIAVCAIFNTTEALELTWWPLARDCSFYLIALMTVVIVFQFSSPKEIEWWEALVLLAEYLTYCVFMKFNGPVHDWVEAKFSNSKVTPEPQVWSSATGEEEGDKGDVARHDGKTNTKTHSMNRPRMFRQSIIQLLTQNTYLYETAGIAAVTEIK